MTANRSNETAEDRPSDGTDSRHVDVAVDDPITGTASVVIDDGPLFLEDYPQGELSDGPIQIFVHGGQVSVGIEANDEDRRLAVGISLDPDGAIALADLLQEFGEKAREGTDWVYP